MTLILRFFALPLLLFLFMTANIHASDWCRKADGGIEPCGEIPSSWVECGEFGGLDGGTIWCYPSTKSSSKGKSSKSMNTVVLSVAAGAVFVGVMWYLFKTPKSQNFEGQVTLATF